MREAVLEKFLESARSGKTSSSRTTIVSIDESGRHFS